MFHLDTNMVNGHFWQHRKEMGIYNILSKSVSKLNRSGGRSVRSHAAKQHLTKMVISKLVFETRSKENGTDRADEGDGPSVRRIGPEMEKRRRDKLGRKRNKSKFRARRVLSRS